MKNLITLLLVLLTTSTLLLAQNTDPLKERGQTKAPNQTRDMDQLTEKGQSRSITTQDYQRYIDNLFQVDYRNAVTKAAALTPAEIKTFDDIFFTYESEREKLQMKRADLIKAYREEMMEDDSEANQDEDRADFIEDYWENIIAGMELKKEYFDDLADKIPSQKAAAFFMLDDAVDLRLMNNSLASVLPTVTQVDRPYAMRMAIKETAKKMEANRENSMMNSNQTDAAKYRRYTDNQLNMDFRNAAYEALQLTSEDIDEIDPLFYSYMAAAEELAEKRDKMLEGNMKIDHNAANSAAQMEDYADFFEDYREVEIESMKLKKNYFDRMEDKVGTDKAIQFFLFEDAVPLAVGVTA